MLCVKCETETEEVKVSRDFSMWGKEQKKNNSAVFQENKSPIKAYVCPKCGYIEFYANIVK